MTGDEVNSATRPKRDRWPAWLHEPGVEMLWTAAIGLIAVTAGYALLPGFIRMMGKSGRIESVEWAAFLAMGAGFPLVAAAGGWAAARIRPSLSAAVSGVAIAAIAALAACFFRMLGAADFLASVLLAAITLAVFTRSSRDGVSSILSGWGALVLLLLTAAWGSAFRIASWTTAGAWMTQSFRAPIVIVLLTLVTALVMARVRDSRTAEGFRVGFIDIPALLVIVAFSFRTDPVVELYHWSFWVGPIESVHQGGWLLWDVPSQYGFLSILLPSLLPTGNGWQSLYYFQSSLYALTAAVIYLVMASLSHGALSRLVALAFTATAFFFRPRTLDLILPAQMTPAGGPMRFVWCYAILLVLLWKFRRGDAVSPRRFALTGTAVWIASVAWSAESAIYTTIAWGGAYAVYLLQSRRPARIARGLALPFAAVFLMAGLVTLVYVVFDGHAPDPMSYYEYALLFSGGYNSMAVETLGAFWYLFVLFILVSAAVVRAIARNPLDPALFVYAGAWGTVWGISSYFVSRSHPVNLLSLLPLLIFALVISLHALMSGPRDRWLDLMRMVSVPLIAMPIALTLAHKGLPSLLRHDQLGPGKLTAQVPEMDPSLADLARAAGMRPTDPVFFASDGRYLMPRWPELVNGVAQTNPLAWVPKPYEMISTLSAERRDTYIERFHDRMSLGGWLIHKKSVIDAGLPGVVSVIEKSYAPAGSFENRDWLIIRYERRHLRTQN